MNLPAITLRSDPSYPTDVDDSLYSTATLFAPRESARATAGSLTALPSGGRESTLPAQQAPDHGTRWLSKEALGLPADSEQDEAIRVLQVWEGEVEAVDAQTGFFKARLRDRTDRTHPLEEAEIDVEEVHPTDLALLRPGAVFYWHIARITKGGTRQHVSQIKFRRLPPPTLDEFGIRNRFLDAVRSLFKVSR